MKESQMYEPTSEAIESAALKLEPIVLKTALMENRLLSENFSAEILLKREDLQLVRSYKLRGAYNKISSLSDSERKAGIVCASAGNHAQGVAYSCQKLGIRGAIFMPTPTPEQKVQQVRMFGQDMIDIHLAGDTYDDAYTESMKYCHEHNWTFVHPFDDEKVIEGQGTVGVEILDQMKDPIDYLLIPIGGGGLASGLATYFREKSPGTRIIGVEPAGAPAMKISIEKGENTTLETIDKFVDGAAVRRVGEKTFPICRKNLDSIIAVDEGQVCSTILTLYNKDAIVVEPAGALTIAALHQLRDTIKGKRVVCVVSGSNNDITRMEEIKERSLLYGGLKHYFIVRFPQRAGALKEFVNEVLSEGHDITHFEYKKKHNRERGPVTLGIEIQEKSELPELMGRMDQKGFRYEYLNDKPELFQYLI